MPLLTISFQAITAFRDVLIPPLEIFSDSLSSEDADVQETHALTRALAEELEELASDIQDGKDRYARDADIADNDGRDSALENRLISLLKQYSGWCSIYLYRAMVSRSSRNLQILGRTLLLRLFFWTGPIC